MTGQRIVQSRKLAACEGDAIGGDQLETGEAIAERRAHRLQQSDCAGYIHDRRPRRYRRSWLWKQFEHRRCDDAEGAFAAEKEMLQIVPGIVLAQSPQATPDATIGQHHFEAYNQIARVAVAEHGGTAGVGR